MGNGLKIQLRNSQFELLPERCAYIPERQTLLVSDLHWGKAETFQRHGLAINSLVLESDLARLERAVRRTKAERVLILGDLIHTREGVTPGVVDTIARWRTRHSNLTMQLIRGNHDRMTRLAESWDIEDIGTELREGEFLFLHDEAADDETAYVWTGHLHPVVRLEGRGDSLRLPCFVAGASEAILPAFSEFTGGAVVSRSRDQRLFAIAGEDVIEV